MINPFGPLSDRAERLITAAPAEKLGNFIGIAMVNIARGWVRGDEQLAIPAPIRRASAFWRLFQDRCFFDPQLAATLARLNLDTLSLDTDAWYPYTRTHLLFWETVIPYIAQVVFPIFGELAAEKVKPDCAVLHYRIGGKK